MIVKAAWAQATILALVGLCSIFYYYRWVGRGRRQASAGPWCHEARCTLSSHRSRAAGACPSLLRTQRLLP